MLKTAQSPRPLVPARHERRGAPRVAPPGHIRCELTGVDAAFETKDISVSGIALWANQPLSIGREFGLMITLESFTLVRRARIVRCKREAGDRWLLGLTFVDKVDDDGKINELIKLVATEFRAE